MCPTYCGNKSCNDNGECCNEMCVGGCHNDNVDKCYVCRHFVADDAHTCITNCPADRFKHYDRRCITEEDCRKVTRPFHSSPNDIMKNPYIPYDGVCSMECPANHYKEGESGHRRCRQCEGPCKRECRSSTIDSINAAQQFRGCTKLIGTLIIQIRSQGGREFVSKNTHRYFCLIFFFFIKLIFVL